ncbi:uncharacterized protein LOC124632303 [Helicoverpa zea]|uniref:uncharacterized protein LOC124632303 n=1 Tax=Helicoverpa zea TaxID=7113 RepID=UPI001F57F76F|nr:uncharacterized protein LOC124632303 [Helicoverpa zea]
MSSNSWSSEDDEILIDFVRNHEAIYNIKSKDYRKSQLKQNWWREIGEILNKTASDCSKRWCYIRDYYIRRRGKPGTGSSGEAAKKRSDLLSFLDSLPSSQRGSITNVVDENIGDSSVKMENTHDISEGIQTPEDGTKIMENTHNSEETLSNTQGKEDIHKENKAKSSDKKRKHIHTHSQERLNLLKKIVDRNYTQSGLDENDLFFGSMAKIVKRLPPYEQVQLRLQIGSLVGNAELRQISIKSPQDCALSPRLVV